MSSAGEKTCVLCGQDCSGKPRIKDKHGRYACRACAEARRRGRTKAAGSSTRSHPRPAAVVAEDIPLIDDVSAPADQLLADLPAAPAPSGGPCPGCGMPTKPGAVICMGCGFNIETGSELATRVKERKVREPIGRPSSARLATGAGLSGAGAAIGLGLWVPLATSTGRPWYSMAALVGVLAGVGMLVAVRGAGRMVSGWIATGPGLVAAGVGLVMFAPAPTEPFPNPFLSAFGGFEGYVTEDMKSIGVLGDDEAAIAGSVWLALAGVAAFSFGRSNPDEDAESDDDGDEQAGSST